MLPTHEAHALEEWLVVYAVFGSVGVYDGRRNRVFIANELGFDHSFTVNEGGVLGH